MAKKSDNRIVIDPLKVRKSVRDEAIKDMIATTGGTARVFVDRKKARKVDPVGRKSKYKKSLDND